ncbi:MAG: ECF transporter S component [Clostridiales bacterium]|nr:ECF transporter S component [Clostridiales bacterium]
METIANARRRKTLWLTRTAIFAAIVIVVQLVGGAVKIGPVSFSLVLVPIVVGGMITGPASGAVLGLVFGIITLINGLTGADPFTSILLHSGLKGAVITPLICLVKATAAGYVSGLIYKLFKNGADHKPDTRNREGLKITGTFAAAAAAPIVNTGLFILGALTLSDVLAANFVAEGTTVIYFLVIGCAGINFIVEFFVNLVLAPGIYQVVRAISKGRV